MWSSDNDLIVWGASSQQQPAHLVVADFAVSCVGVPKRRAVAGGGAFATAIRFPSGGVRSVISTLLFYGAGVIPGTVGESAVLCGDNLDLTGVDAGVTDTVTVRDTLHWFAGGMGVAIGRGSEVRVLG